MSELHINIVGYMCKLKNFDNLFGQLQAHKHDEVGFFCFLSYDFLKTSETTSSLSYIISVEYNKVCKTLDKRKQAQGLIILQQNSFHHNNFGNFVISFSSLSDFKFEELLTKLLINSLILSRDVQYIHRLTIFDTHNTQQFIMLSRSI